MSPILGQQPDSPSNRHQDNDNGVDEEQEDVEYYRVVVDDGRENRNDASCPVGGTHFFHLSNLVRLNETALELHSHGLCVFTATCRWFCRLLHFHTVNPQRRRQNVLTATEAMHRSHFHLSNS